MAGSQYDSVPARMLIGVATSQLRNCTLPQDFLEGAIAYMLELAALGYPIRVAAKATVNLWRRFPNEAKWRILLDLLRRGAARNIFPSRPARSSSHGG